MQVTNAFRSSGMWPWCLVSCGIHGCIPTWCWVAPASIPLVLMASKPSRRCYEDKISPCEDKVSPCAAQQARTCKHTLHAELSCPAEVGVTLCQCGHGWTLVLCRVASNR
jgi:hypothetical protein